MKIITVSFTLLFVTMFSAHGDEQYFNQFAFKVVGQCEKSNAVFFEASANAMKIALGSDDRGREKYANVTIQLFTDHTYWVAYEEDAVTKYIANGYEYVPLFKRNFEGKWVIKNDRIELSHLGFGVPKKLALNDNRERNGFGFRFTKSISDPRLLDVSVVMIQVGTNIGPKGISINQYCQ